jgi:uncharacterized protein involved in type VI secretion and phage assembly
MALPRRDTKVTCSLGDEVLPLETFRGHEALGAPFRYSLTLLSKDPNTWLRLHEATSDGASD